MATITWTNPAGGAFDVGSNWSGGVVPGAGDDAVLPDLGTAYTVSIDSSETVNSLQTASGVTAAVEAGVSFEMTEGTGSGVNAGQIVVEDGGDLYIGGTFDNTSTASGGGLVLDGGANGAEIRLIGAITSFTGGGQIVLGGSGNDTILDDAGSSNTLDNQDTIVGAGFIGDGAMTLVNGTSGVIEADGSGLLTLEANGGVINYGLIESAAGGELLIHNTAILQHSMGRIEAIGSSTAAAIVELDNATISGADIIASGGPAAAPSLFEVVAGSNATFDGSTYFFGVVGLVKVLSDATLYLKGRVNISTAIDLSSGADIILPVGAYLSGRGEINLNPDGTNSITAGYEGDLTNYDDLIDGAGSITVQDFGNADAGVIDANQAPALTITSSLTYNFGVLESDTTLAGAGGLVLSGTIYNVIGTSGGLLHPGVISASGTGHVELENTYLYAGVFSTTGSAYIEAASGTITFDGSYFSTPIYISGGTHIDVANGAGLILIDYIDNAGVIDVRPGGTVLMATQNSSLSLSGGGEILLSADGLINVNILNNIDNNIVGSDTIHQALGTITNEVAGTIDAAAVPGSTTQGLDFIAAAGISNEGVMVATTAELTDTGVLQNRGWLIADGANMTLEAPVGMIGSSNKIVIAGASVMSIAELDGAAPLTFANTVASGSHGVFVLGNVKNFAASVIGFSAGDEMVIHSINYHAATYSYSGNTTGGTLTVTDGTVSIQIAMVGDYVAADFHLGSATAYAPAGTGITYTGPSPSAPMVVDTAINLSGAALDGLEANSAISSILVSDSGISTGGVIQLNAAELVNDAGAIAKLAYANGRPVALQVTDTAANLSGATLDALQANGHVTSIIVSDNGAGNGGRLQASVAQLTSDAGALAELVFANGQTASTIRVSDTAANLSADLDALSADSQVGRLWVSDNLALTVSVAQLTTDATALNEGIEYNRQALMLDVTDTSSHLNGAAISNLINAGDGIDATDIAFSHLTATFSENSAGTAGTLTLADGTHTAAITLFGQFAAAGFSGAATAAGFSVAADAGTGSKLTLLATVPA